MKEEKQEDPGGISASDVIAAAMLFHGFVTLLTAFIITIYSGSDEYFQDKILEIILSLGFGAVLLKLDKITPL